MARFLRHPGRVALLLALAALLNAVPIHLPGDARFFLGTFIYMPLVLALPAPWAVFAAAIPMAVTIIPLGHPFAFLIATFEALWLVVAQQRWRRTSVVQDALFWALVGLPAVFGLCYGIARLPGDLVAIVAVKQILNQFAAVALAVFLLRHTRLAAWLEDRPVPPRRMREIVFSSVFMLAMVPFVAVAIGVSALLWAYCRREDREMLANSGVRYAQQMDLFLTSHAAAVTSLAAVLDRGGGEPSVLLEETQRTHPAFITMLVTDADGRVTHAAPARLANAGSPISVADREYFRQARDLGRPYVSGVFRGRGFGRDVLVAISAPRRDAAGRFAGIVQASLEVNHFAALIAGPQNVESASLILADREGRVIHAAAGTEIPVLANLHHFPQGVLLAAAATSELGQFDQLMSSGRLVRFTGGVTRAPDSGLLVLVQRPLLAGLEGAGWVYVLFAGVACGVIGAAFWVARSVRRQAAAPLEYFASSASQQAERQQVEPVESPFTAAPYEVTMVFRAFNQLATRLKESYAMLLRANEDLDRRVVARTAETEAARRQAEAASQSKTDFLAMTSHEIRTPLNAIIGLADSLAETAHEGTTKDRLRTIRQSGRRLLGVVNDLLDLTRVEAGKLELRPAPVELGGLCGEVHALFALRAQQAGLAFDVDTGGEQPLWLETDGPRLQQVLINLVGNALKFTPSGRIALRISRLAATAENVTLRFAISDTGPGIPEAEQARLFQPYVQLTGAGHSAVPGTGLGLSISRRLVDLFGGTLALRSAPGEGSEFFFTLVLAAAAPPAPLARTETRSPFGGLRVLAADDNLANQEVLRALLEGQCADLTVVDDGEAAVAALAREEFDVALIDLEMPVGDGFFVARTVRGWAGGEASRGCRLVALSAHGRAELWPRCEASGFDDFVEKPIERTDLRRVLRAVPVAGRA